MQSMNEKIPDRVAAELAEVKRQIASVRTTQAAMKARMDAVEPGAVEKTLSTFKDRVKVVDEIIKTCVLRATVATELSFLGRNAGEYEREFVSSDVIYALDLPHSFWVDNYSETRTIEEWVLLIRQHRFWRSGRQSGVA